MTPILTPEDRKAIYREWLNDKVNYDEDGLIQLAEAAVLRKCGGEVERLRGIVDKGSFLSLIEDARSALKGVAA